MGDEAILLRQVYTKKVPAILNIYLLITGQYGTVPYVQLNNQYITMVWFEDKNVTREGPKTSRADDDERRGKRKGGMRASGMIGDVHCVRSSDMVDR